MQVCHFRVGAQASVAILDRKMAALKAEISQQAAVAAQKHKFNQGSAHPTGDASPRRLASGLAATAQVSGRSCICIQSIACCVLTGSVALRHTEASEPAVSMKQASLCNFRCLYAFRQQLRFGLLVKVMAQSERLCRLAADRRGLVEGTPAADVSGALAGMQDRSAALSAAILDAEAHISSVLRQKRDGQSNRGAPAPARTQFPSYSSSCARHRSTAATYSFPQKTL